jgi:hypothetical protein
MNRLLDPLKGDGRFLHAGLTLAVTVALFAYGGLWLDKQFGSKPWLLLLCVVVGIVGGILHLIRVMAPESWPFGASPKPGAPGSKNSGSKNSCSEAPDAPDEDADDRPDR